MLDSEIDREKLFCPVFKILLYCPFAVLEILLASSSPLLSETDLDCTKLPFLSSFSEFNLLSWSSSSSESRVSEHTLTITSFSFLITSTFLSVSISGSSYI
jgi:hypothetical protein